MLTATSRQSWSYENMVLGPVVLGDWGNKLSPDDWGLVHARPLWIILEPGREGATTIVPMLQEYPIILVANGQLEKTARPPSQRLAQQGSGWCQCPTAIYTVSRAGSGVVRIDPLSFLAGCRTRRLNQALSVLSLSLGFFWCSLCVLCC